MVNRTWRGYALLITGIVACPCHFPLWIGLIAGTAVGGFFLANWSWLVAALFAYFVVAMVIGFKILQHAEVNVGGP